MAESSLLLFTLLLQGSVGITLWLVVLRCRSAFLLPELIFAFGMGVAGVMISFLHLGYPLNAFNVMRNVATSWLSREVVFSALYLTVLGLCTLIALVRHSINGALLMLAGLLGTVAIFCMAQTYIHTAVATWQHVKTLVFFLATMGVVGSVFIALASPDINRPRIRLAVAVVIAMVLARILVQPLWIYSILTHKQHIVTLPHAPLTRLLQLREFYMLNWTLSVVGMALFAIGGLRKRKVMLIVGGVLLMLAEIVLRYVFFCVG